jgi:CubicO group peptidase (beta-lactamase class C family)
MSQSIGSQANDPRDMVVPCPDDESFTRKLEEYLDKAIATERVWNLHGIAIVRDGRLIFERYFEGEDNARGRPLGNVTFKADTLHDVRSVSKSIVGLLYGIALARGEVPAPEAPLFDSYPEYPDLVGYRGSDQLTIHHVLTMTMGTDWDETSIPYSNPENSEIAMDRAPDRYRFILERRPIVEPGTRWKYCGGGTALLGHIIARGVGKPLHSFAREVLFDPLTLGPTEWMMSPAGEPFAASGLRMSPRDLARIGSVMSRRGSIGDHQVLPARWIEQCTSAFVSVDELRRFGYHWYVGDFAFGEPIGWAPAHLERWWGAFGEGGQRLFVMPGLDLAIAITAGNYGRSDQRIPASRIMSEVVLPSLLANRPKDSPMESVRRLTRIGIKPYQLRGGDTAPSKALA